MGSSWSTLEKMLIFESHAPLSHAKVTFVLLFSAFNGWRITEAAVEIIKASSDGVLRENSQSSSTYSAWRSILRKNSLSPVKMYMIMRWMTYMAACEKKHLVFEQAQPRFLGDASILCYISIIYGGTYYFYQG